MTNKKKTKRMSVKDLEKIFNKLAIRTYLYNRKKVSLN